ncbi:MAG: restriction endonuclease [Gordonia polyisoprenivorans]|nr:restriction endonuclease [Gordonia polyisoprenivorans]
MDETQHRLREWTNGQHSERLAAQVLAADGWEQIDPSHPYGGKDGGKDLICYRDGKKWVVAVHFPRGRVTYSATKKKLRSDVTAALAHEPHGVVFVTNQEISLTERQKLDEANPEVEIAIYHMERVAGILDRPGMHSVRAQYLDIDDGKIPLGISFTVTGSAQALTDADNLRQRLCDIEEASIRKRAEQSRETPPTSSFSFGVPTSPFYPATTREPVTPEEENHQMQAMRDTAAAKWSRSLDYLAERALAGVGFTVTNTKPEFLNHVQVQATFHRARGIEHRESDPATELYEKMLDPDYVAPTPLGFPAINYDAMGALRLKDNPVQFENEGHDLIVTIDLAHLRPPPSPGFRSDLDELIVVALDPDTPVEVTWFVTADTYGTPQYGDPIELPTHAEDARAVFVRTVPRDDE